MIDRYCRPKMKALWSEDNKLRKWLEIEVLVCEALAEAGTIPKEAASRIRERAEVNVTRVKEIERDIKHDVVSFLTAVSEQVGPESRFIHLGLTSSDILDTTLALLMRDAATIIIDDLRELSGAIRKQALRYKDTPMIGRTHGVHAEPTTFGVKLALWHGEARRNLQRMESARDAISYGKISGAVGTFANIDPSVEGYVCDRLGLKPEPVSSQIVPRDRHAEFLCTLAIIASSLEKFATEIRSLQRTDVREVEEFFSDKQKGSSAMPHKRNPELSERICGMARLVRGNCMAALENVALWHERDISHSSVERIIIPDSTILLDYMLDKFTSIVEGLLVYPEAMTANIEKTNGLIFSEHVMLELIRKGLSREEAYKLVQRSAMKAWAGEKEFRQLLNDDADVRSHLSEEEIESCFDVEYHLKHVDTIFRRAGIEE